jgi:hypothetical protein
MRLPKTISLKELEREAALFFSTGGECSARQAEQAFQEASMRTLARRFSPATLAQIEAAIKTALDFR